MSRIVLTLIILVFAGEISFGLTWQDVLSRAGEQSNDIKSARNQLESSKWSYLRSYSGFLPQVSANAQASGTPSQSYSYGLSATQYLFKGLSNYYDLQSSYLSYQYDDAGLKKSESDVYYNVRTYFVSFLTAQENVEVQKKILESRKKNARMIKLLYESGKEDKGSFLRTEAQVADAEYSLASAMRDLELARYRLSQILQIDISSVEEAGHVQSDKSADINSLTLKAPSYLQSKYTLEIADIAKRSTVGGFLPNVYVSGNYQKSGSDWPPSSSSKSLSLNISYSLFPGGSNIADAYIYSSRYEKAKEDYEQSKKDISYGIKNAYLSFQNAVDAYNVQEKFLNASAERAKIAQARYLNGLTSYYEWDQIQNEYISYQRSTIQLRRAALVAQAAFYKSYGGHIK